MREIILHCFNWKVSDITKNLGTIKKCNYSAIQISVVQPCKNSNEWWALYQPLGFTIGNRTGSKEDLIELCSEAHKIGITIVVDVVLRHVCTDTGELIPGKDVDKSITDNPDFFTNAENAIDYNDRHQVIFNAIGLPMLNYNNEKLQDIYIKFLQELKDCKVDGYRIDAGKHFGLESEGSNFWPRVFGGFSDMFNYGECLDCSTELLDQYTEFINVLSDKDATDKSKMVTYFMSHDTELTFEYTTHMTDQDIIREWEYLLKDYRESHVLFYCRAYSNLWRSDEIRRINLDNQ